ncbi:VOC family protein [Brachybacterium sp. JHP9]|uniref:VOC family protein n=1 Tax=Brachybacterium equifaecis TaxID=2910770 RepID=A0ABT0QYU8_9MICO|nr:VOC family protein [Brachybacterium equifaecis]MCL6422348.1 VOC family protein [Brachybacterium equifaecis]
MAGRLGQATWLEYLTGSLESGAAFYRRLAGWEIAEGEGAASARQLLATADGEAVASLLDTTGMLCPMGRTIPTKWEVYLQVDDLDARLERARAAGGEVIDGPREAIGGARLAVVADPTGCPVGLWEGEGFAGRESVGAPGTPVWFELMSMDTRASRDFYQAVLDFDYQGMPGSESEPGGEPGYFTNAGGQEATSGLCSAKEWFPAGTSSFWRWYLAVDSMEEAVAVVREMGGKVLDGPMDSPFGIVATIEDPDGATLQILEGPRG